MIKKLDNRLSEIHRYACPSKNDALTVASESDRLQRIGEMAADALKVLNRHRRMRRRYRERSIGKQRALMAQCIAFNKENE